MSEWGHISSKFAVLFLFIYSSFHSLMNVCFPGVVILSDV